MNSRLGGIVIAVLSVIFVSGCARCPDVPAPFETTVTSTTLRYDSFDQPGARMPMTLTCIELKQGNGSRELCIDEGGFHSEYSKGAGVRVTLRASGIFVCDLEIEKLEVLASKDN